MATAGGLACTAALAAADTSTRLVLANFFGDLMDHHDDELSGLRGHSSAGLKNESRDRY